MSTQVAQVTRHLEQAIADGRYVAGRRLPAERTLADQLQVSRATAREAIGLLVARGVLERRQGDGTYVVAATERRMAEIWQDMARNHPMLQADLVEFRAMLEGRTAELAALRHDDGDRERLPSCEEWVGRLYLESVYTGRPSYLRGETLANDLTVVELLPERLSIADFPGFKAVNLTKAQLDIVVRNQSAAWSAALSSVKGVYVITDTATGRLYVGKASGADGIWGRWCAYAANGHGGNVALRQEFGIEASEERRHALRFAVLEIADLSATEADLCERESHWKSVLLSRNHGFNRN
ncbi:MAG: hypothetical protein C0521_13735 [Xanthomonas sp.]|nr:hypothetical protein [Xanthomonas sp.]